MKLIEITSKNEIVGNSEMGYHLGNALHLFFSRNDDSDILIFVERDQCGNRSYKYISREELISIVSSMFAANGGGDIRSIFNCRSFFVGYDNQSYLCCKHEDDIGMFLAGGFNVYDASDFLLGSDQFDGF